MRIAKQTVCRKSINFLWILWVDIPISYYIIEAVKQTTHGAKNDAGTDYQTDGCAIRLANISHGWVETDCDSISCQKGYSVSHGLCKIYLELGG